MPSALIFSARVHVAFEDIFSDGDAELASNNIFGDLRISSYTPPSFDMITRVFENVLSSGSTRNENVEINANLAARDRLPRAHCCV